MRTMAARLNVDLRETLKICLIIIEKQTTMSATTMKQLSECG